MFSGLLIATRFTKKMESKMKQLVIQTLSAVLPMTAATVGMQDYAEKEHDKLLKKYNAMEIFYKV